MIQIINKNIFYSNLNKDWKKIFLEEYKKYGKEFKLYGFYNKGIYLGGFCSGYNPDFFEDKKDQILIQKLLNENYIKISYFHILNKYRGKKIGKQYLLEFLNQHNFNYFLTCNGNKLKKYYLSLGFELLNDNNEKHILVFNRSYIL